jgi:hypothetical protein
MNTEHARLQHRLTRYSLAAGAVGLAASTSPADAAIVFSDNGGVGWTVTEGNSIFFNYTGGVVGTGTSGLEIGNSKFNRFIRRDASNRAGTSFLSSGISVTAGMAFPSSEIEVMDIIGNGSGNFSPPPVSGYLALRFGAGPAYNYGWMDITLDAYNSGGDTIVINGIAVESTPNTAIVTGDTGAGGGGSSAVPEPGTLGLLVLGATGLAALRRREG